MPSIRLLIIILIQTSKSQKDVNFDRSLVGGVLYPYVKNWEGEKIPGRNSYSVSDIRKMLNLIAQRFSKITTFGMGVTGKKLEKLV